MSLWTDMVETWAEMRGRRDLQAARGGRENEIGATGTEVFFGQIQSEEFNTELQNLQDRIDQYTRMRNTDGQVQAAELGITLPILGAKIDIQPASDQRVDMEVANVVERALRVTVDRSVFVQTGTRWTFVDDYLRHALLHLSYGFMPFEKVKQNILLDGKPRTVFKKIAPRLPKTVYDWVFEGEDFKGIKQQALKDGYQQLLPMIPEDKLVLYVHRQEGNDLTGRSVLRAAYTPWKLKNLVYKIAAMGVERNYLGIPYAKIKQHTAELETQVRNALKNLRAHEQMYLYAAEASVEFTFLEAMKSGRPIDVMPLIRHWNEQITGSVLLQFLDMGRTESGSRHTTGELRDFFILSLEATARKVEDMNNLFVIPDIVHDNFPNVTEYPKLVISNLKAKDLTTLTEAFSKLGAGGFILPDPAIEDWLRELLEAPKREGAEKKAMATVPVSLAEPFKPARPLVGVEKFVAFAEIDRRTRAGQEKFGSEVGKVQQEVINFIAVRARAALNKQKIEALGFGKDALNTAASKLESLENRMTRRINAVLRELFEFGQQTVKDEVKRQKSQELQSGPDAPIGEDTEEAVRFLQNLAIAASGIIMTRLRDQALKEVLDQMRRGQADAAAVRRILEELSPKLLAAEGMKTVMTAFNLGRKVQAERSKPGRVIRSEVLDVNTCEPCAAADGRTAERGTAAYDFLSSPPYPDCEAAPVNGCRGIAVFEF